MSFCTIRSVNASGGVGFDSSIQPNPQPLRLNDSPVTFSSTEPIPGPIPFTEFSVDPYQYTVVRNGTVYVTNDATQNQRWELLPSGPSTYSIGIPGAGQVWTVSYPGGPIRITFWNGSPSQQFQIQVVNGPDE